MRMGTRIAAAALGMAAALGAAQTAQAQARANTAPIACGGIYNVQRGDTLASIAARAYGAEGFQLLYLANTSVIGPDPNLIEIGMPLRVPCLEQPEPAAEPPAAPAEAAVRPAPVDRTRIDPAAAPHFIGIAGNAPFSDAELPGGGMFTELLRVAMQRATGLTPQVDFASDWNAQLAALLPGGGHDVGFPWVRPNCDSPAGLGAESRARCRTFVFSDPFFEIVLGFYTTVGSDYASAASHADLIGARICRPEGMFVGDLENEGLVEPAVSLVARENAVACVRALMYGEVDVVSTDAAAAAAALTKVSGAERRVTELEGLATLHTLHAVAPRQAPQGVEMIEKLNGAQREMRASGEWFSTLEKYRAAASGG